MAQPLPPHLLQSQQQPLPQGPQFQPQPPTASSATVAQAAAAAAAARAPYGSGDHDDGYSLLFPSLEAFHTWREQEEEVQMVEFVKGDTHGSKAIPPRFKDHTKLVCARHSRSGRKKYVKKHPERVRKVPSRKIEGQGCSASISFKTYFDTEEVRACYNNQHSHEVGLANLPFTRRGRKAAVEEEKTHHSRRSKGSATPAPMSATLLSTPGPSSASAPPPQTYALPQNQTYTPAVQYGQPQYGYQSPLQQQQQQQQQSLAASQERWDRMSVLFDSIRSHARQYEYPASSVVALESVLIRLYLESPVGSMGGPTPMPVPIPGQVHMAQPPQHTQTPPHQTAPHTNLHRDPSITGMQADEKNDDTNDDRAMSDDAD